MHRSCRTNHRRTFQTQQLVSSSIVPFAQLTRTGQIRRLRRLARNALAKYDLVPTDFKLLEHWNNTTFKVRTQTNGDTSVAPQHYVLRINRPGFQNQAELEAEVFWLATLRQDLAVRVPHAISNSYQKLVTQATAPGIPQPRNCILFGWLAGRFFNTGLRPIHLEKAGTFLAHLHTYSQTYTPPPGFTRKSWTSAAFFGAAAGIDAMAIQTFLSTTDKRFLVALRQNIECVETTLGQQATQFGLIHGDFYHRNFFFHQNQIGAIDFDECGWGYYLYDVAVTLAAIRHRRDYPQLRQALLKGYRQIRPLTEADTTYLPIFICARLLGLAIWVAGVTDHPDNRRVAPHWVTSTLVELQQIHAGDTAL